MQDATTDTTSGGILPHVKERKPSNPGQRGAAASDAMGPIKYATGYDSPKLPAKPLKELKALAERLDLHIIVYADDDGWSLDLLGRAPEHFWTLRLQSDGEYERDIVGCTWDERLNDGECPLAHIERAMTEGAAQTREQYEAGCAELDERKAECEALYELVTEKMKNNKIDMKMIGQWMKGASPESVAENF